MDKYLGWCWYMAVTFSVCAIFHATESRPSDISAGIDADERNAVNFSPEDTLTCLYDNKTYPAGAKFQPNSCTNCHCPKHGGRAKCAIEDCRYQPNCMEWKTRPNECCGTCLKIGCLHSDGNIYEPGTMVVNTACETCHCPQGGGRTICTHMPCPRVRCVDAVPSADGCCKECPNGPNCWLDGTILPAGHITMKDCNQCYCPFGPLPHWMKPGDVQAMCTMNKC